MADRIVTAPKWWTNKWQWIPRAPLRCIVCLSMKEDPDNPPVCLFDLVHKQRVVRSYGINRPPPRAPNWSEAQLQRRKEFIDRAAILSSLYVKADGDVFDMRKCAEVLARTGREELAELLAMADEQVAHNGKRTGAIVEPPAHSKRERDKRKTEARDLELQKRIEQLRAENPKTVHERLCEILNQELGGRVSVKRIMRITRVGPKS